LKHIPYIYLVEKNLKKGSFDIINVTKKGFWVVDENRPTTLANEYIRKKPMKIGVDFRISSTIIILNEIEN